jgi:hypothetical protein
VFSMGVMFAEKKQHRLAALGCSTKLSIPTEPVLFPGMNFFALHPLLD